ncbi:RNA-guided endonuclease IscB [Acrocarpospora sp. B8E8]|uniref:RNA-guided endonuclease IscB n=1 Tax=Acrocarpospora sp. B8E8 TaxID=3153572 RepID=UPI00325E4671
MEHVREETTTASPGGGGVTPDHQVREQGRESHPYVFVLDKHGTPLQPTTPARARKLLTSGRAVVARHTPFVIRLKDRTLAGSEVDGVELGVDPGSRHTGIAAFTTQAGQRRARYVIQLDHRGATIRTKMAQRAAYRRGRRTRNLRYRAPRFLNRTRPQGWLPPSLTHRVVTTTSWVDRLARWAPVRAVHVERVAFDTHAISAGTALEGAEYQHGTLHGTEVRQYLLAKWGRACAYCGATGVPLNIDHIQPSSKGGSDRVSNLCLACLPCNQAKSSQPVESSWQDSPSGSRRSKHRPRPPCGTPLLSSPPAGLYGAPWTPGCPPIPHPAAVRSGTAPAARCPRPTRWTPWRSVNSTPSPKPCRRSWSLDVPDVAPMPAPAPTGTASPACACPDGNSSSATAPGTWPVLSSLRARRRVATPVA